MKQRILLALWLASGGLAWAAPAAHEHQQVKVGQTGAMLTMVAVLAPLLAECLRRYRVPIVVLEILLGMAIGPHCLGLARDSAPIEAFSLLGLCFLFFMAGLEIDFFRIRGRPLALALRGWMLSLVVATVMCGLLYLVGWVKAVMLVAVALSTTAIGTLLPILKESGQMETEFGTLLLGIGAAGEFGPIALISLLAAGDSNATWQAVVLVSFASWLMLAAYLAYRVRPPRFMALVSSKMHTTSQLPVRLCVFLMTSLVFVAGLWGIDVILGAFGAGAMVGLATRESRDHDLIHKLDSLSFGFLIPMFFISTGMRFDLPALALPQTQLRVLVFLLLLLVVRGVPALLLYPQLSWRDRWALAFYSATGLPLIVAIAEIGERTGRVLPENCVALVGAGMLSVLLFPMLAAALRTKEPAAESTTGTTCEPSELLGAQAPDHLDPSG